MSGEQRDSRAGFAWHFQLAIRILLCIHQGSCRLLVSLGQDFKRSTTSVVIGAPGPEVTAAGSAPPATLHSLAR